jgi:transcriptional regulator with XRE-family HTH domain
MTSRQTALGKLLQERREAVGYSRTRAGALVGIKPGTIEGWELGRVAKPPIHDIVRLAHFLGISADEIQRAVFEDAGEAPVAADAGSGEERKKSGRRREHGAVPLLDAAFQLFAWKDASAAADALNTTADQVERWRSGVERMEFADFLALTSMIGVAAAEAMRREAVPASELAAAAEALGVRAV